jgi:flagellar basal-body rod protein FlgB
MPHGLLDRTVGLLKRSLDIRTFRQQVLARNISNSTTPDYRPVDIPFQRILNASLDSSGLPLRVTHSGHLPGGFEGGLATETSQGEMSLDEEMAKLAENNLMYQASVQALVKKLEGLKIALIEGGK